MSGSECDADKNLGKNGLPTNLRLAAANRGATCVAGRTPITVPHMGGRDL